MKNGTYYFFEKKIKIIHMFSSRSKKERAKNRKKKVNSRINLSQF